MKKFVYLLTLISFIVSLHTTYANTFIEKKINDKTIRIIDYDLSSAEYDLHIWYTPDSTNIRNLMIENNGVTAINGVFFCPSDYSACWGKTYTINEHYIEWEKISWIYDTTWDRVVFWWDKQKVPFLFQTDKINKEKEKDIYEWFANHPLLLKDGQNMLEYWYDSFLIDQKMTDERIRNFICNDKEKKHIYFWLVYDVTLDDLIPILSEIGCSDALNLDAGKSTAFVYNGHYVIWPQRPILDGLIIQRKWLNIKNIDTKAKDIIEKLWEKLSKKSKPIQVKILKSLVTELNKIRISIYEKNSIDLTNPDGSQNGYKIEIKDLNTLKKVYYINSLNYYTSEKIKTL